MIERIGLVNFLEGVGVEVDPNMVSEPRESNYMRTDRLGRRKLKSGSINKPN